MTPQPVTNSSDRRFRSRDAARMVFREVPGGIGELIFYPIVFESPSEDLGGWREIIGREAVEAVVTDADIRAVYNHDPASLLGRTRSGTLSITVDDYGVPFRCTLPDTSAGRDVAVLWQRGDLSGGSFLFTGGRWVREGTSGGLPLYRLVEIEAIWEGGPVTFPAYSATELSTSARSLSPSRPPSDSRSAPAPALFGTVRAMGDLDLKSFLARLDAALQVYLEQPPWSLVSWWDWYVVALYDTSVVVFDSLNGRYLQLPYTVAGVELALGAAVEVVARWEPVEAGGERKRRALLRHVALGGRVTVSP